MKGNIKNGVYPTMLTPFTPDNKIDYDGVLSILDYYKKTGVDGIFAICQSSEIFYLSFEERLELLDFIRKNMPADISLVASGHTADDIDRQIYEANAFIDKGIDAYVFISNRFCAREDDDSYFLSNYEKVVGAIPDVPLGIYECPYPYKKVMMPALLEACINMSNLSFIKDTCCDINLIREKLRASQGSGLKIFNANGATFLESLKAGCAGYSGVMANFHPELYVWLCNNFEKQPDKAKKLADFLSFASTIELQQYPVNAKYHMQRSGVKINIYSRVRDCGTFSDANKMEIDAMIETEKNIKEYLNLI